MPVASGLRSGGAAAVQDQNIQCCYRLSRDDTAWSSRNCVRYAGEVKLGMMHVHANQAKVSSVPLKKRKRKGITERCGFHWSALQNDLERIQEEQKMGGARFKDRMT